MKCDILKIINFPETFIMRCFLSFLFMVFSISSMAQLQHTSWTGAYKLPEPTDAVLAFGADSMTLSLSDGDLLEVMKFRQSGDTLYFIKLSGMSDCSTEKEAAYLVKYKDDAMFLVALSDDCEKRKFSFPDEGLHKVD